MIEFRNINLSFGNEHVLDHFNMDIKKNQKVVIRGSSGIGKSTIINLILGFIKPDSGEIIWKDKRVSDDNIHQIRSQFAWLPQDFKFGSGSVKEVILFPFQFRRNRTLIPDDETIITSLTKVSLDETILKKKFADISEGQKQRIGLVLCLLLKRDFILLDEPTSSLDQESKQKVIELFLKDENLTILSTSHDPEWIKHCEKVIDLKK